jgi:hypothetical protein
MAFFNQQLDPTGPKAQQRDFCRSKECRQKQQNS